MKCCFAVGVLLTGILASSVTYGADWSRIGADAGFSKYSSDNIYSNATLNLQYAKRFYSKYAANKGNFFYGSSVVTRGGKAVIIADDRQNSPDADKVTFMQFDWLTGQAEGYYATPWALWQNDREVDSHHYTNPIIWHSDGRVYMRRGGDTGSNQVFLPETGELITIYNRGSQSIPQYDATALMQTYKDMLICRYGHTYYTQDYCAVSIAEACFAAPNQEGQADTLGRYIMDVGPSVSDAAGIDGLYGSTGRYGDIPKCANDVCVMAGLAYSSLDAWPDNTKVWLEATDLTSAQTLWTRTWVSDSGGQHGLATSISDYWRFIATDSGHYVFFTRAPQQPVTVRAVDLRTGQEKWTRSLVDPLERPLLAYHAGYVYVIGRADQYKLDINSGAEVWHTTYSWPHDRGYVIGNHENGSIKPLTQDPLYRPAVLTDGTLWFVDGDGSATSYAPTAAMLVGIRVSDSQVVQQVDLQALYSNKPNESLLVVNDLLVSNGLLGVLVGVRDSGSLYPNTNGIDYQDLYVFRAVRPGDLNGDGRVDIFDVHVLMPAWGTTKGAPGYIEIADLNHDGQINMADLQLMVSYLRAVNQP